MSDAHRTRALAEALVAHRNGAGAPSSEATVDVAGVETIQLLGQLRWEGQKVEGAQAQLASAIQIPGARLFVTQIVHLPTDGRYDVRLPRGEKYSAWFWQPATDAKVSTEWIGSGAAVEVHDIDLR